MADVEDQNEALNILFEIFVGQALAKRWKCHAYQCAGKLGPVDLLLVRDGLIKATVACKRRVASFDKYPDQIINRHGLDVAYDWASEHHAMAFVVVGEIIDDKPVFRYTDTWPDRWPVGKAYRKDRPNITPKPAYQIPNSDFQVFPP